MADKFQNIYTDTENYDSKPAVNESQTAYTDIKEYENKRVGELQTTYTDTENYDSKPAEDFQPAFTDNDKYKNKLADEFQTTLTSNETKSPDEFKTTFNDEGKYKNNPIDTLKSDLADDDSKVGGYGESANANPTSALIPETKNDIEGEEKPQNTYELIDEAGNTFVSPEEGEKKLIPEAKTGNGEEEHTEEKNKSIHVNKNLSDDLGDKVTVDREETSTPRDQLLAPPRVTEAKISSEEEEKRDKPLEPIAVLGSAAAGAYALYEKKQVEKDPNHAQNKNKIEEGIAAVAAVGAGSFAFHEKKETNEEPQGKKKHFNLNLF